MKKILSIFVICCISVLFVCCNKKVKTETKKTEPIVPTETEEPTVPTVVPTEEPTVPTEPTVIQTEPTVVPTEPTVIPTEPIESEEPTLTGPLPTESSNYDLATIPLEYYGKYVYRSSEANYLVEIDNNSYVFKDLNNETELVYDFYKDKMNEEDLYIALNGEEHLEFSQIIFGDRTFTVNEITYDKLYRITYSYDEKQEYGYFAFDEFPALLEAIKEGYNFKGWFEGENQITEINENRDYNLTGVFEKEDNTGWLPWV